MSEIHPDDIPEVLNGLGHVSSGVGHHVINAFSAIVSNAEILRLKIALTVPVDPAALADMIISTALEAASVARQLIDYTRPITSIGDEHVHLDQVVADYVESRKLLDGDSISWTTALAPVPPIRGMVDHLGSMLDHFVMNAREASEGPATSISLGTSVDTRGWVVLEVRDSGRGMTPEVMERAVEPFFTTKGGGHPGVGLSIANGIWRRHKGTLSIKSVPGEGTTLRLCVEPSPT